MSKQVFRPRSGRVLPLLVLLALAGCTGMLLGGGNSGAPIGSDARTATQVAADDAISGKVRARLAGDATLHRYVWNVYTVNRRVVLYATVDSFEARDHALQLASSVSGVNSIDNRIRVDTQMD